MIRYACIFCFPEQVLTRTKLRYSLFGVLVLVWFCSYISELGFTLYKGTKGLRQNQGRLLWKNSDSDWIEVSKLSNLIWAFNYPFCLVGVLMVSLGHFCENLSVCCMFLFLRLSLQIHYSKQGQLFKSQVQSMHKEILQSPWLCELMAFHINLRETKVKSRKEHTLFDGCSLTIKDGKPSLSCELFDSIKLDADLTCSICLVSFSISVIGWVCFNFNLLYVVYLNITVVRMHERCSYVKYYKLEFEIEVKFCSYQYTEGLFFNYFICLWFLFISQISVIFTFPNTKFNFKKR